MSEQRIDYGTAPRSRPAVLQGLRAQAHEAAESFAKSFMEAFGPQQEDLYDMARYLLEKHLLPIVMKECHGNLSEVSRRLGLNRATTRKKLCRAKIPLRRLRKQDAPTTGESNA